MAWLSELSARAVSVLEDVDHLAAESLNPHSTPGSRYTPRRKISRNTTPLPTDAVVLDVSQNEDDMQQKTERTSQAAASSGKAQLKPERTSQAAAESENALLKQEVAALEDEVSALTQRVKSVQGTLSETWLALEVTQRSLAEAHASKMQLELCAQQLKSDNERLQQELAAATGRGHAAQQSEGESEAQRQSQEWQRQAEDNNRKSVWLQLLRIAREYCLCFADVVDRVFGIFPAFGTRGFILPFTPFRLPKRRPAAAADAAGACPEKVRAARKGL
jgi:hypothetical protein